MLRAPFELGWRPSHESMTPALMSSWLKRAMASNIPAGGGTPASLSASDLRIIMKRIVVPPLPGKLFARAMRGDHTIELWRPCAVGAAARVGELDRPPAGGGATASGQAVS